ncbi:DNRLRE domain-containing protein [candidate division KSB1 bacterium]|nr:DNRLRE domain-containing protein [candidate division KSB1 bacterium]
MKLLYAKSFTLTTMSSITFVMILMLLGGCTVPESNPTGASYVNRIIPSVEKGDPVYSTEADSVFTESPSNSSSYYLYTYTGDDLDDRAVSTVLFPPLADSTNIDSVKLYLHQSESNMENGSFSVSLHTWNQDWQDAVDNGDDFPDALIPDIISTWEITEDSVGNNSYTFDLDPDWVETWLDTTGFILIIDEMDNNAYARFYSKQNSDDLKPRLDFYIDGDTLVTETVYPLSDTYYVQKPAPNRPDLLFMDNGTHDRIRLQFDVSSVAEDITINLARLILYVDTLVSQPDPSEYYNLSAYRLIEDYANGLEYDASNSSFGTLETGQNSLSISVTAIVQGWTSNTYDNFGFLLKGYSEGLTMDRRGFYMNVQDSTRMPRLELYYTPPLTNRY